ncbi:MAG TPA: TIGR03619 family F420-dependent LLM class oxidoreductase [Acidimicrobiia bacterium]|nr:TIGR03619 family F420-dependent LLM class oxidoreductase [Acidimicrobiia bacterium]
MKVSVGLPTHRIDRFDDLASADAIADLSREAEEAGFDAVFVTEHPIPEDRWLATGGHHTLDPFVALAFAAAATDAIRLQTNLCIPAYRNPFLLAKTVATLDALSAGRVVLGIGAGYLEGEFAALGVDFDERNELTDEAIEVMRAAWAGESVARDGRRFAAAGNTSLPRPAQDGGPPIWIGGNSMRAVRRAVDRADGWAPMPSPATARKRLHTPALESLDDLAERIGRARDYATDVGRTQPLEIVFMPLGLDMFTNAPVEAAPVVESIRALADVGVTYVTTTVPGDRRDEVLANLATFRDEVLPEVAAL